MCFLLVTSRRIASRPITPFSGPLGRVSRCRARRDRHNLALRFAHTCTSDSPHPTRRRPHPQRRRAGAFDNEAARKEPQSTLATIARLQGNNAAKALRAIALGEAERQRALCNTPEGLKQCHAVIEFLVALHHRVAVDCRGLPSAAARAARILWAESYLSGMRYGVHRTLVKLFDQLSLDNGKTKVRTAVLCTCML